MYKLWLGGAAALAASAAFLGASSSAAPSALPAHSTPAPETFAQVCAGCHGALGMGGQGPGLMFAVLRHGQDDESIVRSIKRGYPESGMPPFEGQLTDAQVGEIVSWLKIRRLEERNRSGSMSAAKSLGLPEGVVRTAVQSFRVEKLAKVARPHGIAFMPDGRMLITQQTGALRVYQDGKLLPEAIAGTPRHERANDSFGRTMLDVAVHPNGWIYLTHGGRLSDGWTGVILSRGHIRGGRWVDNQDLLRLPAADITGARLAIDAQGYIYTSISGGAMAETANPETERAQDLSRHEGKILRISPDGSAPTDNPFRDVKDANPYVWTLGHRSVMGMVFDQNGQMLESEDGPRGGDEVNRVERGKNYGWPVITWGHRYDELLVAPHTEQAGMEQPIVSWVPAPAVSSAMFYTGNAFPGWKNSLFVGALKARNLFRIVVEGDHAVLQETILYNAERMRDIETGPDGLIYIVTDSGDLVRLVPA